MKIANPDARVHTVDGEGGTYIVRRSVHDGLGTLKISYYILVLESPTASDPDPDKEERPAGRTEYASKEAAIRRANKLAKVVPYEELVRLNGKKFSDACDKYGYDAPETDAAYQTYLNTGR